MGSVFIPTGAPALPVPFRVPVPWVKDGCQHGGYQMVRLFYDVTQTPSFTATLNGSMQQSIGLIKSLVYNIHFEGAHFGANEASGCTVIIESGASQQRITLGLPADVLTGNGGAGGIGDFFINGCAPFWVFDDTPISIYWDNFETSSPPSGIFCRFFFCNWDVPPYGSFESGDGGTD
jgi:hypothetical protein